MTSRTSGDLPVISHPVTRRRALSAAATVGLSLPVLSACGNEPAEPAASRPSTGSASDATPGTDAPPGSESPSPSEPTPDGTPGSTPEDSQSLAATSDIPVGGGVVYSDARVVVTQPAAGDFKCFSAVCTHTGCLVAGVSTTIVCPCHGSSFDISTGEVLGGPAAAPLPPVDFTIEKDQVVLS